MRLIIVRHGETVENKTGVTQGQIGGTLTELGRRQSYRLAKKLSKEKIDVVYCSDLKRCRDTLKPLLKVRKLKVYYTRVLREQSKGVFEGRKRKEYEEWKKLHPNEKPRGWETMEEVAGRIYKFVKQKLKTQKGRTVLVVSHGGTKQVMLHILFGRGNKYGKKIGKNSPNTGITILDIKENKKHDIELFYSKAHLGGLKQK